MAVEGGGDYRQRLVQRQLQIKKRKKAGLSNTRADAGPPSSSRTFSSPPKDEPIMTGGYRAGFKPTEVSPETQKMLREATGLPGAYRALPGGPETESAWDYLDLALIPVSFGAALAAPSTGGGSVAASFAARQGIRQGARYLAPKIAKATVSTIDPGFEALAKSGRLLDLFNPKTAIANIPKMFDSDGAAPATVMGDGVSEGAVAFGGPKPNIADIGLSGLRGGFAGQRAYENRPENNRAVFAEGIDPNTGSSLRSRPLDIIPRGLRTKDVFDAQEYSMDKSLYEEIVAFDENLARELPEPLDNVDDLRGDRVYFKAPSKGRAAYTKKIRNIVNDFVASTPHGRPPTAKSVLNTATSGVSRTMNIYQRGGYNSIAGKYSVRGISAPKITFDPARQKHLEDVFIEDFGENSWYYSTATGVPAEKAKSADWINNEHVYAVSSEATRHNDEMKALDEALDKRDDLSKEQKRVIVQRLVDKHQSELAFIVDPNKNNVYLTRRANQDLVKSADPEKKIEYLYGGRDKKAFEGGKWIPVPELGKDIGVLQPLHSTVREYENIINMADKEAPTLNAEYVKAYRRAYDSGVKPLRETLQIIESNLSKAQKQGNKAEINKLQKQMQELISEITKQEKNIFGATAPNFANNFIDSVIFGV